ncbi:MAG: amidohydrolase family protein [Planctomycetes bacterium]|jgi:cytosine/adenosine deaminase-related metal-dependent hydrolase|nr:amidohydrolase family protein [Planctomycetota bacterium]
MNDPVTRCYRAAAVQPADGPSHRPGTVVWRDQAVAWVGPTAEEPPDLVQSAAVIDLPDRLLLPGMVNAHAHLELTAIGPRPYPGDFLGWVRMLREHWPGEGDPWSRVPDESWFADAARRGAAMSLAAGVTAVGDICRSNDSIAAQREAGLGGIGYLELFGMGPPWDAPALARLTQAAEGLQPHAPYSAGPRLFDAAARSGKPVCTHLAETRDELEFIADCRGPFRAFLERIGKWDDAFAASYQRGLSPVRWMRPYLEQTRWLVAHGNYLSDADIALLAETGTSVAYCPIASEYFGHAGHRYRDLHDAGVNVCLGTDSIVCQPADEVQPLGILPQMRRLYERDRTDPALLLKMATTHGRHALGLPQPDAVFYAVRLDPADPTDPLIQVLTNSNPMEPLPDA